MTSVADAYAEPRRRMVETQLLERRISPRVAEALGRVPREMFVGEDYERAAYTDTPLPLQSGQTISQPYIVALTADLAKVRPGDRVLEVGTGSGYAAAVLAELGATVHTIERIPSLAERGRRNLERAGYGDVQVHVGDGTLGLPAEAPFRSIVVAAAAPRLPRAYPEQLLAHGRVVLPLGGGLVQRLVVWINRPEKPTVFESIPCRFVPLIGAEGYPLGEGDSE